MSLALAFLPLALLAPAQRPAQGRPTPGPGDRVPGAGQPAGQDQAQPPTVQLVGEEIWITAAEEGGDLMSLDWLTKLCQQQTGRVFTYDEPTSQALNQAKVRMLGTKKVPREEFYSFYQILMFIHGFTLTKVGPDHLALYLVQGTQPQAGRPGGQALRNEWLFIDVDDVEKYADQVATQVITVMHLPHVDVRQLGNTLRMFQDAQGQQAITSVGTTNSVLLQGFASTVNSMVKILRIVDQESARDSDLRPDFDVIRLEFAAAEDLADVLEQLLEAKRRAEQQRSAQNPQGVTGAIGGAGAETKILTDPRTNSLLVMAMPADMQNIRELVARLDEEVIEPERTYHVYALENVKAEELAEVLDSFLTGAARGTGGGPRGGGGQPGQANVVPGGTSRDTEIVVEPDAATNSLLIAASKRRYEEILELVRRLDRRQDQVLIETALIEVSGSDSLDLGVELGFADLPGSGTGGFGVTNFGLGTFQDTDGDGIPDVKVPNTSLGAVGGILDGDDFAMPVLIAALRDRKDTNVLNIPSVLVNNNFSATVKSIESQPTTTITATGGVGGQTQENFNSYQDAGVTMQISPSISASGYLRLDVSLEVSVFQGNFQGAIPPPKVTRVITTSVNVPDGDTMVVGGIIVDNKNENRTSVPVLGDLPLVGALFRRETDNGNRTTLYFFVTPHIMRDKNFADLAEKSYQAKLNAAEVIGAGRIRMVDPLFGKEEEAIDLRGFDLPLYRSPRKGEVMPSAVGIDPAQPPAPAPGGEPEEQKP